MVDLIEKINNSVIQHGKLNNRVYVMKLYKEDFDKVMERCEELCKKNSYTKIFAKIPRKLYSFLSNKQFVIEAVIPKFYNNTEDCIFCGKYFDLNRSKLKNSKELEKISNIVSKKKNLENTLKIKKNYTIKNLTKADTQIMAELYQKVFSSYPFPISDKNYLAKTMDENVKYAGIFHKNNLVSIASAETDLEFKNSEMSDFATLPEYRGNNFSFYLLNFLEQKLILENYKTLYTIARANSAGMNITFKKNGYNFSGTLKNNTNIGGNIENMNVWYKNI